MLILPLCFAEIAAAQAWSGIEALSSSEASSSKEKIVANVRAEADDEAISGEAGELLSRNFAAGAGAESFV